MRYPKLSGAHFHLPSSVVPSKKPTAVVGWHRRWHRGGSAWLVPAASTSPQQGPAQGNWVETLPPDAQNTTRGLEPLLHKCWWRWPLGHAPDLGGRVGFAQPSRVLEISPAENTASPALCLGDGFYPPGNVSVILLRGRYKINAVMHLSIRYRRTELSAKGCKSR